MLLDFIFILLFKLNNIARTKYIILLHYNTICLGPLELFLDIINMYLEHA